MRQSKTSYSTEITAEWDNKYADVVISCDLSVENDSIGTYEYWGAKCYDSRPDYFVPDSEIEWDKTKHTPEENEGIEKYINENEKFLYDLIVERFHA